MGRLGSQQASDTQENRLCEPAPHGDIIRPVLRGDTVRPFDLLHWLANMKQHLGKLLIWFRKNCAMRWVSNPPNSATAKVLAAALQDSKLKIPASALSVLADLLVGRGIDEPDQDEER